MCMGGSRGDGGAAERRRAEEERQARIGPATQKSPISSKALTMRSTTAAVTHISTLPSRKSQISTRMRSSS